MKCFFDPLPDDNQTTSEMTTTANYWTATAAATSPRVIIVNKHVPGFLLTKEERKQKFDLHKYGLCCQCDAGLDDRADFVVCDDDGDLQNDMMLMCNACDDYYVNATDD